LNFAQQGLLNFTKNHQSLNSIMKVKVFDSQTLGEVKELNLALVTKIDGECAIGRAPHSGLVLESPDVSRLHGKFLIKDGEYFFSDLGSVNGSIVNGKNAEINQRYPLKVGDVIRLGEFVLIMEDISEVAEELPETVISSIDATIISGWRSDAKAEAPELVNQVPIEVSEVPERVSEALEGISSDMPSPEAVNEMTELVTQFPELAEVHEEFDVPTPEVISPPDSSTSELVSEVSEPVTQAPKAVEVSEELTYIQPPESAEDAEATYIQASDVPSAEPAELLENLDVWVPEDAEVTYVATPEVISPPDSPTSGLVSEVPEISKTPEAISSDIPDPQAVNELSELVTQVPELAEDTDVTYVSMPEESGEESFEELTYVPARGAAEVTYIPVPEPVSEVPEQVTQAPEAVEISEELTDILSAEAAELAEATYIQVPEVREDRDAADLETAGEAEATYVPVSEEPVEVEGIEGSDLSTSVSTYIQVSDSSVSEGIGRDPEPVEVSEVTNIPAPEPVSEVPEPVDIFGSEMEAEATYIPTEVVFEVSEPGDAEATYIQASDVPSAEPAELLENLDVWVPEDAEVTYVSTPEVISPPDSPTSGLVSEVPEISETPEAISSDIPDLQAVNELPELLTQVPELAEDTDVTYVSTPEESREESSEITAQTPKTVSEAPGIICEKYIALMAHESKKSDLVQLVVQHKELFLKCLTVATPPISQALHEQAGVSISQQTPTVPVGGYQTIASLVGAGDILAVIFLRDFLVAQAGQSNDEALLRLCNVNQVLFATNTPTAEAVLHYIKDVVMSS
jgi:methylglyoxal synthase